MARQPFERMVEGGDPLLPRAERLVVEAHRRGREALGQEAWTPAAAYRWLRFEDPDPIRRLIDGVDRLSPVAEVDEHALELVIERAAGIGYPTSESSGQ